MATKSSKASGKKTEQNAAEKPEKKPAMQPVKPRGKATRQSEAELKESTSAPKMRSKADRALADWRKNAPSQFRDILEAR